MFVVCEATGSEAPEGAFAATPNKLSHSKPLFHIFKYFLMVKKIFFTGRKLCLLALVGEIITRRKLCLMGVSGLIIIITTTKTIITAFITITIVNNINVIIITTTTTFTIIIFSFFFN